MLAVTSPDAVVELPTARFCNVVVTEPPTSALATETPTPAPSAAAMPDAVAFMSRLDIASTVKPPVSAIV